MKSHVLSMVITLWGLAACAPTGPVPTPTKTPAPIVTIPLSPGEGTLAAPAVRESPGQPDLSGVVLTSADLPSGFLAATPEVMAPVAEGFTQAPFFDVVSTSGFTMTHPEGPELIVTFSGTFTEDNPFRDDAPAHQKPLYALYMFIFGTGSQEIAGDGQLSGLEGIGQEARGYFGLTHLNEQPIRVDLVVFRRHQAGVYVFHLYPQDRAPVTSVIQLAQLLDRRLSAAVGNG